MRRLFSDAHYDFISARKRAYIGSAIALGVCLVAALAWQISSGSWLNYGVDFAGGTLVQLQFEQPTTVSQIRDAIGSELPGSEVTQFGQANEFLVRVPTTENDATATADRLPGLLNDDFGEGTYAIERTETVGAKVGAELQSRALLAVLLSFVLILAYLAVRFEWRFGLAAITATGHDVLLTLGLISLLRLEVALPTVAAVLTILGYSLNDKIVIFDRIRENLTSGKRQEFAVLLNRSINDTLPRTVLTSVTTLVTLLSLFLLGGEIIRPLALILILGIIIGTYSSIFIAAPALLAIEKKWPGERKKASRPVRARTTA
jgi:preprotein translocase subunit SecF